jgi:hypothetical protein
MRRCAALVIVLSLSVVMAPASYAAPVRWTQNAGNAVHGVAAAPDGGVYVTGERLDGPTREATLIKYGPNGGRWWTRSWRPRPAATTRGIAVAVAPDGTVYLLGSAWKGKEGGGWFIRSYSPSGDLRSTYLTPAWDAGLLETVADIAVGDSQVVVAGWEGSASTEVGLRGWVRSFSPTLSATWTSFLETPASIPSAYWDRATGAAIGASGDIFVAGWAATEAPMWGMTGTPAGTVVLEKLDPDGRVAWSRRPGKAMYGIHGVASISVRAGRVMVVAPVGGLGAPFFALDDGLSKAWLARFTTDGTLVWARVWGRATRHAADPTHVFIGPSLYTWVVGARWDHRTRTAAAFLRVFGPDGRRVRSVLLDPRIPFTHATDVVALPGGGVVTGYTTDKYASHGHVGKVWRLAG